MASNRRNRVDSGKPDPVGDPAGRVIDACRHVINKAWTFERAVAHVEQPDAARRATQAGCARLIRELDEVEDHLPDGAEMYVGPITAALAVFIVHHARAVARAGGSDQLEIARDLLRACRSVLKTHQPENLNVCLMSLAEVVEALGQPEEALAIQEDLLRTARNPSPGERAEFHNNIATTLAKLGRLTEAVREFDRVLEVGADELPADEIASVRMNRASIWKGLGDLDRAVAECSDAIKFAQAHGTPETVGQCWRNLGNVYRARAQYGEAVHAYTEAIAAYRQGEPHPGEAHARLGRALAEEHDADRRGERFGPADPAGPSLIEYVIQEKRASLAVLRDVGRPDEVAQCEYSLALSLSDAGQLAEAGRLFAGLGAERFDALDRYKFLAGRADCRLAAGDRAGALADYAASRRLLAGDVGLAGIDETALEFVARRQHNLAREASTALALGHRDAAYEVALSGKAVLFDRLGRPSGDAARPVPAEFVPVRERVVAALRADPGAAVISPALEQARVEYGQSWTRHRPPGNTTAGLPSGGKSSLADIRAALPTDWAVVDFLCTAPKEVTAFVVTRDRPLVVERLWFPHSHPKLHDRLDRTARAMTGTGPADDDSGLDDLDELLFAPLRPHLTGIRGLYLVPHGHLHAYPLDAARRRVGGRDVYLADEFETAYLPAAGLLPGLPRPAWQDGVFSVANPGRGRADSLPFADWEAARLKRFGGLDGAYLGGDSAVAAGLAGWGRASLVHFSGHGTGVPWFFPFAHLHLRDGPVLAHDVLHHLPPVRDGSVVVLNGCETGVRDQRAVDEGLGLMAAFLLRGAGGVLATRWRVNDCCAAELAVAFVNYWTAGAGPAKALQLARNKVRDLTPEVVLDRCDEVFGDLPGEEYAAERAALRGYAARAERSAADPGGGSGGDDGLPDFRHPRYWAAFQYVGRAT